MQKLRTIYIYICTYIYICICIYESVHMCICVLCKRYESEHLSTLFITLGGSLASTSTRRKIERASLRKLPIENRCSARRKEIDSQREGEKEKERAKERDRTKENERERYISKIYSIV